MATQRIRDAQLKLYEAIHSAEQARSELESAIADSMERLTRFEDALAAAAEAREAPPAE